MKATACVYGIKLSSAWQETEMFGYILYRSFKIFWRLKILWIPRLKTKGFFFLQVMHRNNSSFIKKNMLTCCCLWRKIQICCTISHYDEAYILDIYKGECKYSNEFSIFGWQKKNLAAKIVWKALYILYAPNSRFDLYIIPLYTKYITN